jgi:hypothetical protein
MPGGIFKRKKSNKSFEAKRRNRVNQAMVHLKMVCLKKTKGKSATKIEVLEIAIDLLREVYGEDPMDFETAYNDQESIEGSELIMKANQSGTADILRSVRERKRRMRVNVLEKELQRLAMYGHNDPATSKREILEQACTALGHPVPAFVPDPTGEYKNPKRMKKTTLNSIDGFKIIATKTQNDGTVDGTQQGDEKTTIQGFKIIAKTQKDGTIDGSWIQVSSTPQNSL